jgi:shikimate dehydrogenase
VSDRFALIGHPVGHSVSPAIHGRAYELLGVQASYSLVDCPDEVSVRAQVDRIRSGELRGANVTVPWKQVAYDLADVHSDTARDVGVANVLARDDQGRIVAYNTDASALGTELRAAVDRSDVKTTARPAALVLGSGGAALAAVVGCRLAGISEILVTARRFAHKTPSEQWPRAAHFSRLGAQLLPWWGEGMSAADLSRVHLLVQATSAGMKGAPGGDALADLIPFHELEPLVAYDLVYTPRETPFLKRAKEHGHFPQGGLGMLVGQARDAIEIWLGRAPDFDELFQAAEGDLGS